MISAACDGRRNSSVTLFFRPPRHALVRGGRASSGCRAFLLLQRCRLVWGYYAPPFRGENGHPGGLVPSLVVYASGDHSNYSFWTLTRSHGRTHRPLRPSPFAGCWPAALSSRLAASGCVCNSSFSFSGRADGSAGRLFWPWFWALNG